MSVKARDLLSRKRFREQGAAVINQNAQALQELIQRVDALESSFAATRESQRARLDSLDRSWYWVSGALFALEKSALLCYADDKKPRIDGTFVPHLDTFFARLRWLVLGK